MYGSRVEIEHGRAFLDGPPERELDERSPFEGLPQQAKKTLKRIRRLSHWHQPKRAPALRKAKKRGRGN